VSDHGDHAVAETDVCDLFAFQNPDDPNKSILIMTVNPAAPTQANAFSSEAIYEILIDTNADLVADVAFKITFSPVNPGTPAATPIGMPIGTQTARVNLATGDEAAGFGAGGEPIVQDAIVSFGDEPLVSTSGDYRWFAGIRSDPFFGDVRGAVSGFQFTGTDLVAGLNVFGMVLEVPNSTLGPNPKIGRWALVVIPHDGDMLQADRAAIPFLNSVFNFANPEDRNVFNQTEPTDDRDLFLDKFATALQAFGRYPTPEEAKAAVDPLLPDILQYDSSSRAQFPNGRNLTDDISDWMWGIMSNGTAAEDGVDPHTDLLPDFPYLGAPNPLPSFATPVAPVGSPMAAG